MAALNHAHEKAIGDCIHALGTSDNWRATKYLSADCVVKATRRKYGYRKSRYVFQGFDFSVRIDRPNFNERRFIAACKKSGEPFPVKKIQLKALPVRKVVR